MKAVFVGKIGESKLYYVLDANAPINDGVVVFPDTEPAVVSFWDTVAFSIGLRKSMETEFHRYLWQSPDKDEAERWYRIFVRKNQAIKESMLNGVQIRSDIMKSKAKQKSLYERAVSFRANATQKSEDLLNSKDINNHE